MVGPPGYQAASGTFTVLRDPHPDVWPANLHPTTFQPIDGLRNDTPSGIDSDLYTANLRSHQLYPGTVADWQVTDGTILLRRIGPNNRDQWNALCGQAIGQFIDDPDSACGRYVLGGDTRAFHSCHIVAYLDTTTTERHRVVAKGSCMNCLFNGQAGSCSLRLRDNEWAQKALQGLHPTFFYSKFEVVESFGTEIPESMVNLEEIPEGEEEVEHAPL